MKEIYQQTVEEVLERVNGKKSGLTSEQVKRSREKCGWNELTEGKKLSIMILVFCGLLFAINVFRGEKISSAFMFAVALAVAAIPEALSSIVTIVLSFGTQKMAKEHAIIRKLQAVEGLGSVSFFCFC